MRNMVFDVESVGLHGEGFMVAYAIYQNGELFEEAWATAWASLAAGTDEGREWVKQNVQEAVAAAKTTKAFPGPVRLHQPWELRDWFWAVWAREKERGTGLWADVSWPVEARFLISCVEDKRPRRTLKDLAPSPRCWEGPFPLLDISTLDFGNPVELERQEDELPEHHPLADVRFSGRKLHRLLRNMRIKKEG